MIPSFKLSLVPCISLGSCLMSWRMNPVFQLKHFANRFKWKICKVYGFFGFLAGKGNKEVGIKISLINIIRVLSSFYFIDWMAYFESLNTILEVVKDFFSLTLTFALSGKHKFSKTYCCKKLIWIPFMMEWIGSRFLKQKQSLFSTKEFLLTWIDMRFRAVHFPLILQGLTKWILSLLWI